MTCQQSTTKCLCSSMCYQQVHGCCKNCRDQDCGVCCPRCQETKNDCKCIPKVQKTARTPELKTSTAMTSADEKMVTRPKEKLETNKHADIAKVLNLFLNTTRSKNEDLEWYIARFERNYAEVKKLGESLSSTCLSVLLLRQAQLPETDNQIISMNLECDLKANNANQSFQSCKTSMRRFQHNKPTTSTTHLVEGARPIA